MMYNGIEIHGVFFLEETESGVVPRRPVHVNV